MYYCYHTYRLTEAHKTAIRVIRRIRYFVGRRKFQVISTQIIILNHLNTGTLTHFDVIFRCLLLYATQYVVMLACMSVVNYCAKWARGTVRSFLLPLLWFIEIRISFSWSTGIGMFESHNPVSRAQVVPLVSDNI